MTEALLGPVFVNIYSLVQNKFTTISGIIGNARKLSDELEIIKAVLEDAEKKQITTDRKIWLQQLKDVVYALNDILQECSTQSGRLSGLSSLKPKNIKYRSEIGNKLKEITSRFNVIDLSRRKLLLNGIDERPSERCETTSLISQPQVYGRQDDKEKVVEFLLSQATRGSDFLSVYPIVGLGGIGKTTLAQMVYNDDRVSRNFDTKIWVYVSKNFSVQRILRSIIVDVIGKKHDFSNFAVEERKVQELLRGKRYLLVLDDVSKENQDYKFRLSQDMLKSILLSCGGSRGASIIISTRDMDVATIMETCQAHCLGGLSEDDCWLLFKQYAFGCGKEERAELVVIGKEIMKKCEGSPRATQELAALLRSKKTEKEWIQV